MNKAITGMRGEQKVLNSLKEYSPKNWPIDQENKVLLTAPQN